MDLNLVRLIFTLILEADGSDPFAFFALKPHFMESFREQIGCEQVECGPCSKRASCTYHQNFSQPLSNDPAAVKRHQKPPLPFVFDIPVLPPVPNSGNTVEIGLTLAGTAINSINEYIAATEGMLLSPGLRRSVKASLLKVESVGYGGFRSLILEQGKGVAAGNVLTLSLHGLQETQVLPSDAVVVTIMTPLRLMGEGKISREISFSSFARALFRRLSSLVYYYGGEEADLDFKWLAEQSRQIECVDAGFHWVDRGCKWSGMVGKGVFAGNLSDFHRFLLAGEYLHVGKGASFGLGRFFVDRAT